MVVPGPQVGDDTELDVALSVLVGAGVDHLLVRDDDGRCSGLVTRAELNANRAGSWFREETRLRDIGHDRGPFTAADTALGVADTAMRDRMLRASPVVDVHGYALGVLTSPR
ncbi:CBS domain-containing protein [Streptomyces sp. NPDC002004]